MDFEEIYFSGLKKDEVNEAIFGKKEFQLVDKLIEDQTIEVIGARRIKLKQKLFARDE